MTLTQWLAVWIIGAVVASPFIGEWLANRRTRSELDVLLHREMVLRQRRMLKVADRIAALPEHEKQRLQREAEALGFLDPDDAPKLAS